MLGFWGSAFGIRVLAFEVEGRKDLELSPPKPGIMDNVDRPKTPILFQ